MKKVITINLNGIAFQIDEDGYTVLHTYLQQAAAKLHDNPDKDEIIADLEQAVADKAREFLNDNKNVVTEAEIKSIIDQMGPVEDAEPSDEKAKTDTSPGAPKRLYKIREGAVLEGVCNGIAAYFDVDVTLVRVGFIVLTILTGGAWIAAYILMAIFVPEARTAEDRAAAQGQPFTTQAIIDSARSRYEYWKEFGNEQKKYWQSHKHHVKQSVKQEIKEQKIAQKYTPTSEQLEQWRSYGKNASGVSRGFAGVFAVIGSLVLLLLGVAWGISLCLAITQGAVLGYFAGAPKVLLVMLLTCLFYLIFLPLQGATGNAWHYAKALSTRSNFWAGFWAVVVWIGSLIVVVVLAQQVPQIHDGLIRLGNDVAQLISR